MDRRQRQLRGRLRRRSAAGWASYLKRTMWITLSVLLCAWGTMAQSQTAPAAAQQEAQQAEQETAGTISGVVVDQNGAPVTGARVALDRGDQTPGQAAFTDDAGQYSFLNVAPGPFRLTIEAAGFTTQTTQGTLLAGEFHKVPNVALALETLVTQIHVKARPSDLAEDEIKVQEQQRVLGVIPNFYVTYDPSPVRLFPKQKFELAWKTTFDPVTFGVVAAIAGVEQAENSFSGYGPGAQGYGKRFGAALADTTIGTFLGSAVLPSILKQDPRYFYKGSGSKRSRILHALAASVMCKGDNGRNQVNYSNILGNLAAGGISNLYYPSEDRNDVALTFESAAIGIGATAGANLIEEFVIPRFTPKSERARHDAERSKEASPGH